MFIVTLLHETELHRRIVPVLSRKFVRAKTLKALGIDADAKDVTVDTIETFFFPNNLGIEKDFLERLEQTPSRRMRYVVYAVYNRVEIFKSVRQARAAFFAHLKTVQDARYGYMPRLVTVPSALLDLRKRVPDTYMHELDFTYRDAYEYIAMCMFNAEESELYDSAIEALDNLRSEQEGGNKDEE